MSSQVILDGVSLTQSSRPVAGSRQTSTTTVSGPSRMSPKTQRQLVIGDYQKDRATDREPVNGAKLQVKERGCEYHRPKSPHKNRLINGRWSPSIEATLK